MDASLSGRNERPFKMDAEYTFNGIVLDALRCSRRSLLHPIIRSGDVSWQEVSGSKPAMSRGDRLYTFDCGGLVEQHPPPPFTCTSMNPGATKQPFKSRCGISNGTSHCGTRPWIVLPLIRTALSCSTVVSVKTSQFISAYMAFLVVRPCFDSRLKYSFYLASSISIKTVCALY